ncbi:hypothetical protein ASE28_11885 [Acidovorax sp. Root219]|nr:hypothetical protein ASE28_11885 [Acidovorax sp. Root219]
MAGYPGELDYVLSMGDKRYEDAKKHLLTMTSHARQMDSRPMLAGCAQRLGEILFAQGDEAAAIALHEFSEFIDTGSLLAKLDHAKFLAKMGRHGAAKEKCEQIISIAKETPFAETDADFSSDQYIDAADRVLSEIEDL